MLSEGRDTVGKANDKKVVREARDLLVVAFSNLLESER
jgi:hypothetical protein